MSALSPAACSHIYLPIVPRDVLRRFHVNEPSDSRFTACARLLQSVWREKHGLGPGFHRSPSGKTRKLGSRLKQAAARTGVTFLSPDIAKIVRHEVAYREIGALIEERRLWGNLLSSQTLTFNFFARTCTDEVYATKLFSTLFPSLIAKVHSVTFEHSPGRGDPRFLGDYTAFDLFISGVGDDGRPAFVAIEVKYAETMRQQGRGANPRYRELTKAYALHRDPSAPSLYAEPLAQLTAEHLLAASIRERLAEGTRGAFVTVAPRQNREVWNALDLYQSTLTEPQGATPFLAIELEEVVEAIRAVGDEGLAAALNERYLDFDPVHALIDDWQPFVAKNADRAKT